MPPLLVAQDPIVFPNLREGYDIEDSNSHPWIAAGPSIDDNIILAENLLYFLHITRIVQMVAKPDRDRQRICIMWAGSGLCNEGAGLLGNVP